jgi:hypothetical protein
MKINGKQQTFADIAYKIMHQFSLRTSHVLCCVKCILFLLLTKNCSNIDVIYRIKIAIAFCFFFIIIKLVSKENYEKKKIFTHQIRYYCLKLLCLTKIVSTSNPFHSFL